MKKMIADLALESQVHIDSAGTGGWHSGARADHRMRAAATARGYDLTSVARQVKETDLAEFDLILVMEPVHRRRLNQKFGRALAGKQVVVLDIPDRFEFMDPALVELLKQRCGRYFPKG
jgi:protein-tyrosine phosphatase